MRIPSWLWFRVGFGTRTNTHACRGDLERRQRDTAAPAHQLPGKPSTSSPRASASRTLLLATADHATLGTMRHDRPGPARTAPLAFFITFRCYGTWLPGDDRGWTDRPVQSRDLSLRSGHSGLRLIAQSAMAQAPSVLETLHREIVDAAIRDVCVYRGWTLHALNVRTNHVHLVVSAGLTPEQVMTSLKAWSTRRLREAGLVDEGIKPWSRHGSTRYLWRVDEIEAACSYVLDAQGGDASLTQSRPVRRRGSGSLTLAVRKLTVTRELPTMRVSESIQ